MSQWLGRFRDYGEGGELHVIFVGGRKSIGGSFVNSLVGKNHKKFHAEVQYAYPVNDLLLLRPILVDIQPSSVLNEFSGVLHWTPLDKMD